MKKFVNPLPNGGIPVFADDILMLQEELYKSSILYLNSFGVYPLILSGMDITYTSGAITAISAGEVLFKYQETVGTDTVDRVEIFSFPQTSSINYTEAYIVMDNDVNTGRDLKATNLNNVTVIKERRAKIITAAAAASIPANLKIALQPYTWQYAKHLISRNSKKIGEISMYGGSLADSNGIAYFDSTGKGRFSYEGFALCNGKNGTRDLRGRFIVGMSNNDGANGDGYTNPERNLDAYKTIGPPTGTDTGLRTVTLTNLQMPSHSHGGRSGGPVRNGTNDGVDFNHVHNYTDIFYSENSNGGNAVGSNKTDYDNNPYAFQVNKITDGINNGANALTYMNGHGHWINPDGGGQAHENRPPFYTLAFIQRIS